MLKRMDTNKREIPADLRLLEPSSKRRCVNYDDQGDWIMDSEEISVDDLATKILLKDLFGEEEEEKEEEYVISEKFEDDSDDL